MRAGRARLLATLILLGCSPVQHVVVDPPADEMRTRGDAFADKALDCPALCLQHLPAATALVGCRRVHLRYDISAGPDYGVICDYR